MEVSYGLCTHFPNGSCAWETKERLSANQPSQARSSVEFTWFARPNQRALEITTGTTRQRPNKISMRRRISDLEITASVAVPLLLSRRHRWIAAKARQKGVGMVFHPPAWNNCRGASRRTCQAPATSSRFPGLVLAVSWTPDRRLPKRHWPLVHSK